MRWSLLLCTSILSLALCCVARADNLKVKIIAFNDFHGNLQSPGKFRANAQSPAVPVGGVDMLAGYVASLRSQNPDNIVVAAGDLIGASPLISALFHDEPTIETLNRLGLDLSSVGNHEFDKGKQELLRIQRGGCSTQDQNTCKGREVGTPVPFEGAKFEYLAANVFDTATGETILPPYAVRTFGGVRIAFIGLTLKNTPEMVTPSGVASLRFADEASTINQIVRQLRPQGIQSFVVLIHQGGLQTTKGTPDINACEGGLAGSPIEGIVHKLDPAVDLVISAHTHAAYICHIPDSVGRGIPVTSASAFGRVLTDIDITLDTSTKHVVSISARNILVDRTNPRITPNAALKAIVDKYAALAAPIAGRSVGSITAGITKTRDPAGESALGDVIADAQLEATRSGSNGAVVAFMNGGGIRTDLPYAAGASHAANEAVTYSELFAVQPFGDNLVTMTLTGAQIKTLLEEQFIGCNAGYPPGNHPPQSGNQVLQVSAGFTYRWNASGAVCNKVIPGSMKISGATIVPSAKYRVTVNSFMADGGDNFYILTQGTGRVGGGQDIDALAAYFAHHHPVAPGPENRIKLAQ